MTYSVFIPSNGLIKTSRWTLQALAIIGAVAIIACAGAMALYAIAWLCSELVVVIHALAGVCHATYEAMHGSYVGVFATFIVWLMLLFSIKATSVLLPSIMASFRAQGGRV